MEQNCEKCQFVGEELRDNCWANNRTEITVNFGCLKLTVAMVERFIIQICELNPSD